MDRTLKLYIFFLVLIVAGIIAIDSNRPKPINWLATYDTNDKSPLGLYILDKEVPKLLKDRKINKVTVTPYEFLEPLYDYDSLVNTYSIKGTFMSISEFSTLDDASVRELLYFADHGNSVFLSMKYFPPALLDSLHIELGSDFEYRKKLETWIANPKLCAKKYNLEEGIGNMFFRKIDTLNTKVLGYQTGDSTRVNFIKVPYKTGNFYLHTQPATFTNFHLLKDDHFEYAEKVLSYLPKNNVYWSLKNQNGEKISSKAMRYIFSQPALASAWYLFLGGMLVFMIFNAKRRQRIVPIVKPLSNTTVDFVKTIGNLYFQEGDHENLVQKKIIYFLEKMRQDYLLDTSVLDDNFIKKLHTKSGKELADIQRLIYLINLHRKSNFTSVEADLIEINRAIEKIMN